MKAVASRSTWLNLPELILRQYRVVQEGTLTHETYLSLLKRYPRHTDNGSGQCVVLERPHWSTAEF